jgi:hypothetical protein
VNRVSWPKGHREGQHGGGVYYLQQYTPPIKRVRPDAFNWCPTLENRRRL